MGDIIRDAGSGGYVRSPQVADAVEAYRKRRPRCAACGEYFKGDPMANVCNTCAANGNYVRAVYTDSNTPAAYIPIVGDGSPISEFVDVSRFADRVSREYAQERQLQLQEYAEARSRARPKGTIDSVKETFVQSPPRDDTGYIDTTQLEHDVARILEAQGPDWYLQPDEPESETQHALEALADPYCFIKRITPFLLFACAFLIGSVAWHPLIYCVLLCLLAVVVLWMHHVEWSRPD